jgi:hypothetical protein
MWMGQHAGGEQQQQQFGLAGSSPLSPCSRAMGVELGFGLGLPSFSASSASVAAEELKELWELNEMSALWGDV